MCVCVHVGSVDAEKKYFISLKLFFTEHNINASREQRKILNTPRQKSIRALEIFRVQKLLLNATS